MTADWVTAVGTAGTFVVIAASAVAALVQISHVRGGNQILALNETRETMESPEFREALLWVLRDLPQLTSDPESQKLLITVPLPKQFIQLRTVGNFFENLGLFVKRRILAEDIVCDLWGEAILNAWKSLVPVIANRRHAQQNPAMYDNFEYLAVAAQQFKRRHPQGTYPGGFERWTMPPLWDDI